MNDHRALRVGTWLLVGGVAALAFAVSFEAIAAYATGIGAFPKGWLRWAAPLLVDTFTVAALLVILARSYDGARAGYAWSLVAVASGVSVALNVAHAPPTWPARLVATIPPIALLASLELVMSEARRQRVKLSHATPDATPDATPGPLSHETPDGLSHETPKETVKETAGAVASAAQGDSVSSRRMRQPAGTRRGRVETAKERLTRHLAEHPGDAVTAGDAAQLLGVSRGHAGRLLGEVRAAGNGDGSTPADH